MNSTGHTETTERCGFPMRGDKICGRPAGHPARPNHGTDHSSRERVAKANADSAVYRDTGTHREEMNARRRAHHAAHREEERVKGIAYRQTPKGVMRGRRSDRHEQVARFGALIGRPDLTVEEAKEMIFGE